jgi:hypothetical protein
VAGVIGVVAIVLAVRELTEEGTGLGQMSSSHAVTLSDIGLPYPATSVLATMRADRRSA